jgi:adenylate cyclase
MEGALGAFSTRRFGGFTDMEAGYLESLASVLGLVIKVKTTQLLADTVMGTYLGAYSGDQVLRGSIARGDGRPIDCVLWYCDLRGSTALAERMELQDYLNTLDDYFDCTAGSVLDHGGEVLKFIGDAVMAIFPIDAAERPLVDMCRAALNTATDALRRVEKMNEKRRGSGQPQIRFGVAMHVGDVMYGNVGTERRLDFTVIGPAVNQATRLEGLCKRLDKPVIASADFAQACPVDLVALGEHEVAGLADGLAAYTLAELAD